MRIARYLMSAFIVLVLAALYYSATATPEPGPVAGPAPRATPP